MTLDEVYALVIQHLVNGYTISLEHYDLPVYRAYTDRKARTRMVIRIFGHGLAQLGWDNDEYGPVNSWDNLEKFEKYELEKFKEYDC